MPQQFIANNGQKLVNDALQSTGLDKVGITTAVDKAGKQLNKQFKKTFGSEDTKNKIALEEQAEKDAKKQRADQVAYNKMNDEQKRAHDNQKAVDQRIKSEQDSEAQKQLYDNSDWGKQQNAKKEREGSCHKGFGNSRPENLSEVSRKIIETRKGGMLDTILKDRDNVSQNMYGKPYSELSEDEKNSATNKQIKLKKQQG